MSDSNLRAATQRSGFVDLPNGIKLEFRPLTLRDWGTLEEAALKEYRRQWVQHKLDMLEFAEPDDPLSTKAAVLAKAEQITLDDCEDKIVDFVAYDKLHRPIQAGQSKIGDAIETVDGTQVVSGFLGNYLTVKQRVPYAKWWLTRTTGGRFMSIWLSTRKARPTMTYDQLCELMVNSPSDVQEEAADTVGELSKPSVGNP